MIRPISLETLKPSETSNAMKVHFVTGKGGVGKSSIAAALALKAARAGQRTLLVDLGSQSYEQTPIGYKPQPIAIDGTQFDLAQWTGRECLKEYILHILKIESLYRLFFENPVSRALMDIAPALSEIAILGKITSGPPRNVGPHLPYDVLVVDSYASGHFLALLRAPEGLSASLKVGPMAEQAREIFDVLRNKSICQVFVVSLPEELPVVEGLELASTVNQILGHEPTLVLNRFLMGGELLAEEIKSLSRKNEIPSHFTSYMESLLKRQERLSGRLEAVQYPLYKLPWVFSPDAKVIVTALCKGFSV